MRSYSARSLRNLRGIHPDLRRVIDRALQDSPLDFVVIEGLRTRERQTELVASGASRTMNSRHLTGHAVDLLPIGYDGKAAFDWPLYDELGPAMERAANDEGVALTWGGRWKSFRDGPHFELDRDAYPASEWTTGQAAPAEKPARTSPAQSTTVQASAVQIASGAGGAVAAVGALDGAAQLIAIGGCVLVVLLALWIMRERLKAWADGRR